MGEWVSIKQGDDELIVGDVIRWTETVYAPRRSRGSKAHRIGERSMAAEVVSERDEKGLYELLVRGCAILKEYAIRKPPLVSNETVIKRAFKTLQRGGVERLLWSDESARSIVRSRFLGTVHR
jgi:hypothetical protein